VRDGLPWVASNTDLTLPTADGPAPGHGVLVDLLARFAGVEPTVAGKPRRPLLDETIRRVGGERPLMIGDRLDTDIAGAINAGIDSLAVLSGVSTLRDVATLPPDQRPTFVGPDLSALVATHAEVMVNGDSASCGPATATVEDDTVRVSQGEPGSLEAIRAVTTLAWALRDRSGRDVRVDGTLES